jgi:shikimate kinase
MTTSAEAPRTVLVGPPGAGKSTVGRLLAERWGCRFTDSDEVIEETEGRTVSTIFVEDGEARFRALEHEVIAGLLTDAEGVIAVGGGAVLDVRTREALAAERVVLLETGIAEAAARVGLNRDRPLLVGNVRGTLTMLLKERAPLYHEVADVTVTTDGRTPAEVADAVEAALAVDPTVSKSTP